MVYVRVEMSGDSSLARLWYILVAWNMLLILVDGQNFGTSGSPNEMVRRLLGMFQLESTSFFGDKSVRARLADRSRHAALSRGSEGSQREQCKRVVRRYVKLISV